jgi:hypothetical protein
MPSKDVMKKFAKRKLHSGSKTGPVVTNPRQAKAIAASGARQEIGEGETVMQLQPPPGTRDYVPCSLCGRPVNMQKFVAAYVEACASNPGLQQQMANTLQPVPPCDVCQERMQQQMRYT